MKLNIANELEKNTSCIYIKENIVDLLICSEQNIELTERLISLEKCLEYLSEHLENSEGWGIEEIPTNNYYCFLNITDKKAFDLFVTEDLEVIPSYLDVCEQVFASSLSEAIEKYDMECYGF